MQATARAHSNIALIKYWGKRDEERILPQNSSLSITLNELYAETTVHFNPGLHSDVFILNGHPATEPEKARVTRFLDHVRQLGDTSRHALVTSNNQVLTAQGLASSAAGFAALAYAAAAALDLRLTGEELSRLARLGSGSACRSVYGGFVEWTKGERTDGLDSYAIPVAGADHWDLRILIAVTSNRPKTVSSREGMQRTCRTSPFYAGWLETVEDDIEEVRRAIRHRTFTDLGRITEHNALKMHATMLGANPPLWYWNEATIGVMNQVRAIRDQGIPAYFTIDAGSNVAVLCESTCSPFVKQQLLEIPGVNKVLECRPGPGPALLKDPVAKCPSSDRG